MSLVLGYGQAPDDIGNPAAMVTRRKSDGAVLLTIADGDDTDINHSLMALKKGIQVAGGLTEYLELQESLFALLGIDMTATLTAIDEGGDYDAPEASDNRSVRAVQAQLDARLQVITNRRGGR